MCRLKEKSEGGGEIRSDDYLSVISVICDWSFQVEMGNTLMQQIHCIQRNNGNHQHRDQETGRTGEHKAGHYGNRKKRNFN